MAKQSKGLQQWQEAGRKAGYVFGVARDGFLVEHNPELAEALIEIDKVSDAQDLAAAEADRDRLARELAETKSLLEQTELDETCLSNSLKAELREAKAEADRVRGLWLSLMHALGEENCHQKAMEIAESLREQVAEKETARLRWADTAAKAIEKCDGLVRALVQAEWEISQDSAVIRLRSDLAATRGELEQAKAECLRYESEIAEVCPEDYTLKETFDAMVRDIDRGIATIQRLEADKDRLVARIANALCAEVKVKGAEYWMSCVEFLDLMRWFNSTRTDWAKGDPKFFARELRKRIRALVEQAAKPAALGGGGEPNA
jgi:chromosome segregation ATPase